MTKGPSWNFLIYVLIVVSPRGKLESRVITSWHWPGAQLFLLITILRSIPLRSRRSLGAKMGFIVFRGQLSLLRRGRIKERRPRKGKQRKQELMSFLTRDTQVASVLQNHYPKVYREATKGNKLSPIPSTTSSMVLPRRWFKMMVVQHLKQRHAQNTIEGRPNG